MNKKAINTLKSLKDYYNDKNEDSYDALFTNFAAQTQTGKRYVQELINMGYKDLLNVINM